MKTKSGFGAKQVYNWQIGRDMAYLYAEKRPKKQFAMLMDTNKCISCQTCSIGCKQTWTWASGQEYMLWNNVETKPYGFYPIGWDVKILSKLGQQKWNGSKYIGDTIFEAAPGGERVLGWLPESQDWAHPMIGEDEPIGHVKKGAYLKGSTHSAMWMFYLQRICNHCTYPACVAACSRQAIYKRPEDGIVLIDQTRCRGYRECVRACPYKKSLYNNTTRISEKCIACYPFIEKGYQNQCVSTCIGKLRLTGFISHPEQAREDNPVDFVVHIKKAALPLYPQFGLEPNVYYFPPINADKEYLAQMFGGGISDALEAYKKVINGEDEELRGLLLLFGATDRIIYKFKVKNGQAYGYDENGELIVSVPLKEPVFIRPFEFDTEVQGKKAKGYLHNT